MEFRMPEDDEFARALAVLADAEGVSEQEALRRAVVEKYAQSRRERLQRVLDEELVRYRGALDRLRDT